MKKKSIVRRIAHHYYRKYWLNQLKPNEAIFLFSRKKYQVLKVKDYLASTRDNRFAIFIFLLTELLLFALAVMSIIVDLVSHTADRKDVVVLIPCSMGLIFCLNCMRWVVMHFFDAQTITK